MRLFDLLVKRIEECCDDGISCEQCLVSAECCCLWDRICERPIIDRREYSAFVAQLVRLRSEKRLVNGTETAAIRPLKQENALVLTTGGGSHAG